MDRLSPVATDALTGLLNALTVHSSVFCLSDLRAPWGFAVDASKAAKFHLVLEGKCWLQLDGGEPVLLRDGDLVILPHGSSHAMRDEPETSVIPLESLTSLHPLDEHALLRNGGIGSRTELLCGGFGLSDSSDSKWLSRLPHFFVLDAASGAWTGSLVSLVRAEAAGIGPGSQAIFAKLADLLLSQALRVQLTSPGQAQSLGLDRDSRVAEAARLLRRHPDRPWTLSSLAREVGMSRTLLAAAFRAEMGDSPMRQLARIRLNQAAHYLVTGGMSVEAIARRTGYASSASLSKAFKREFGISPGTYRAGSLPMPVRRLESGSVKA